MKPRENNNMNYDVTVYIENSVTYEYIIASLESDVTAATCQFLVRRF